MVTGSIWVRCVCVCAWKVFKRWFCVFLILFLGSLTLIVWNSIWAKVCMYALCISLAWLYTVTDEFSQPPLQNCCVVCCLKMEKVSTSAHWLLCSSAMAVLWQIGRECRQLLFLSCMFLFSSSSPNADLCTKKVKIQQRK